MDPALFDAMQERTAQVAIGASALRNQGGPGVVHAARSVLSRLDLSRFVVASADEFAHELNRATRRIQSELPGDAHWGTARKALSIFLRDVLYNTYLERELGFSAVEQWLELPLDSYTATALRRADPKLPRWPGVALVDWRTYRRFQLAAHAVAAKRGIARVHLDIFWWRQAPG